MVEIDRILMRENLCNILQKEYVALLGQREVGIDAIIKSLINKKSPLAGMKFVAVALPRLPNNALSGSEFEEMFLDRLLDAANRIPPETSLAEKVTQAVQQRITYSANYRIRKALDTIGKETSANYLVIILHALANIEDEPLKHLLLMLREYHDQMDNQGEAGERLRFLVAGDARLWHLCYHKTPERSPFNIAERVFMEGLSHKELQMIDICNSLDTAMILRDLTDGIPLLVEEVIKRREVSDDLEQYFGYLQVGWNALPPASQELLKNLIEGSVQFPACQIDYQCPQIPVVKSPWLEAFWEGFLRLRYRQLAWRSQIHQAFVMKYVEGQDNPFKSAIVKVDLRERAERLDKAVKNVHYSRSKQEPLEEAQSLAYQTDSTELAIVLEMVQCGEKSEIILKKFEQLVTSSEKEWLRELGKEIREHSETIYQFMIKAVIARVHLFLSQSTDNGISEKNRQLVKSRKDSGMTTSRQHSNIHVQSLKADVLLVTVAEVEAKAILSLFPKPKLSHIGDQTYHDFGMIGGARTFMVQSEQGPGGQSGAILTIQEGITALHPSAVIMVGIAFGVNENKQLIGDILISTRIMDYDLQRIGTDNDNKLVIIPRGDRPSASTRMLSRFRASAKYWETPPKLKFGLILSGAKLVDNQDFRDQLLKFEPEAIGGEMEGGGLYAAAQRKRVDWILVKAICDWGDGHKKQDENQRQKEAAENAAHFTKFVIEKGGFDSQMLQEPQPEVALDQPPVVLQHKIESKDFDVFLSYNSGDRAAVKKIGEDLKKYGILPWLDVWELRPGFPWQRALEQQIRTIKSAAVFVGKSGMGPWHISEMDAFLRQFKKRNCPIIPVLLPDATQQPDLPIFLEEMSWVDFRKQDPDPLKELIWGITGMHSFPKVDTSLNIQSKIDVTVPELQPAKPDVSLLERRRDDLKKRIKRLSEKMAYFEEEHDNTVNPGVRFELNKQIEKTRTELDGVKTELEEVEAELHKASRGQ